MFTQPPYLTPGDTIALFAPSRAIAFSQIEKAVRWIEAQGFKIALGKTIDASQHQFSGSEAEIANDWNDLMKSEARAIWCAKGGYGTARWLDEVDFETFRSNPKWILGFSDITALLQHILTRTAHCSIHAPMLSTFEGNDEVCWKQSLNLLLGASLKYEFLGCSLNKEGEAAAPLVGGNLSVLYSLMGSNSDMDWNGKILFLEDLDEYLYHIDRMLLNLKRSGRLENLAGLVVGGMTDMNDNTVRFGETAEEIIWRHTREYDYPIAFNFPAGHISKNMPLVIGGKASLNIAKDQVVFTQNGARRMS